MRLFFRWCTSRRFLLGIVFLSFTACATFPGAHPRLLNGNWTGQYSYAPNSQNASVSVTFDATLTQHGDRFDGLIAEANTFDKKDDSPTRLSATIYDGQIAGDHVQFRKQYNGEGGYRHSVMYTGVLNKNHTQMTGEWQVGNVIGPFTMRRKQ